jgi:hypothetical protein
MGERIDQLLQKMDALQARLERTLAQVDDAMLAHEEQIWRVQDVVAHLTVGERETAKILEAHLDGTEYQRLPFEPGEAINQHFYEQYKDLTAEQVREMRAPTWRQFCDAVSRLDDGDLDAEVLYFWGQRGPAAWLINVVIGHEERHRVDIILSAPAGQVADGERKIELLRKLADARRRFEEAAAVLNPGALVHEEQVWRVQDVYTHLAEWEAVTAKALLAFMEGKAFNPEVDPTDHDAFNDYCYRKHKDLTAGEALDLLRSVRSRFHSMVASLDDAALDAAIACPWGESSTVAGLIDGMAWHDDHHREAL